MMAAFEPFGPFDDPPTVETQVFYMKMTKTKLLEVMNMNQPDVAIAPNVPQRAWPQIKAGTSEYAVQMRSVFREKSPRKRGKHG